MKMKKTKTVRGFSIAKFTDKYGYKCSIQKSSLADEDCIWLGVDKIEIKVGYPWRNVSEKDIKKKFNGKEIVGHTRMHLTRRQVKLLLPLLNKFSKTGNF